MGEAEFMG